MKHSTFTHHTSVTKIFLFFFFHTHILKSLKLQRLPAKLKSTFNFQQFLHMYYFNPFITLHSWVSDHSSSIIFKNGTTVFTEKYDNKYGIPRFSVQNEFHCLKFLHVDKPFKSTGSLYAWISLIGVVFFLNPWYHICQYVILKLQPFYKSTCRIVNIFSCTNMLKISMLLLQNYLEKYFNWEFGKYQRLIYLELKKAEHFCFWKKKYLNKHKRKII